MQKKLMFIRDYIEKISGIAISEDNFHIIENRVPEVMKANKILDFDQLCNILKEGRSIDLIDKIINVVTINETFWFRDKSSYTILESVLLPKYIKLLRSGEIERISIWSSACSSGQEPYSIAMYIDYFLAKHNIKDIDLSMFQIIATDICDDVLQKAIKATYDNITMERGIEENFINMYFSKRDKAWVLCDKIRSVVSFQKINLKNHNMKKSNFDIVFCKNVLIYFGEQNRKDILRGIVDVIKQDGVFFIGSSEIIDITNNKLVLNDFEGARYYTLK